MAKRRAYIPPPRKKKALPPTITSSAREDGDEDEEEALRDAERAERETTGFSARGQRDWEDVKAGQKWPPGVEPVLEELPKWGLLAGVLEEIEDDINVASHSERCMLPQIVIASFNPETALTQVSFFFYSFVSHSDSPGSNTILVMVSGDRACTQLREYLSTRDATPPPLSARSMTPMPSGSAGKKMMERLLRSYFWWKGGLGTMSRNLRGNKSKWSDKGSKKGGNAPGPVYGRDGASSGTAGGRGGAPSYKRRRIRGGSVAASVTSGRKEVDKETGEEEIVGAELEDEAEGIADL